MIREALLVKEYRGGMLECIHNGHICIVDEYGAIKKQAGDPRFRVFTRSAAKPIQAIPGVRAGLIPHYGLNEAEVAIMTASHRAQQPHVETLESLLRKTGLQEQRLVCASALPLDREARSRLLREGGGSRKLYHNCSGKHLGIQAYCKMASMTQDHYNDPAHPVQREILAVLADLADYPAEDIRLAMDGCGLPVFNLPLSSLATAYMKLACPDRIEDPQTAEAARSIAAAMNKHPEMVGGSGRIDTLLLEDDNIVAKGGFKGVYAFSLRKERLGIAFKIMDGSEEEWGLIVQEILRQLGYQNTETLQRLKESFGGIIHNDEGWEVGSSEAAFVLE